MTLNLSNCGSIVITKTDDANPAALLEGAEFDLIVDDDPINNVGGPGAEDTNVIDSCTTAADGTCSFTSVLQGEYWVVETVAPTGHDLADPVYQHVTVTADEEIPLTFVNPRQLGAIQVTKTAKHAAAASGSINQEGVTFTIAGTEVVTDENGVACVGGLALGQSYDVVETVPAGYVADGDTTKSVAVDQAGTCDTGFETVSFVNVPLTNITVSVDSQVVGGTDSTISCDTTPATTGDTDDVTGDGSATASDLEPGTYTCTVVIDP